MEVHLCQLILNRMIKMNYLKVINYLKGELLHFAGTKYNKLILIRFYNKKKTYPKKAIQKIIN